MKTEVIAIQDGHSGLRRVLIADLQIPDVRAIALCLPERRCVQTLFAYDTTLDLWAKLMVRNLASQVMCPLRVDIPHVWLYARSLPTEEKELLTTLWRILSALVRHLIPDAKKTPYTGGSTYEGVSWLTMGKQDEPQAG